MRKDYDLRKKRKNLGLSIRAAAEKAGISPASVRAMEVGLFHGKPITLKKLADAYGISVRLLMTPDEQKAVFGDVRVVVQIQEFMDEKEISPEDALRVIRENWTELKAKGRG